MQKVAEPSPLLLEIGHCRDSEARKQAIALRLHEGTTFAALTLELRPIEDLGLPARRADDAGCLQLGRYLGALPGVHRARSQSTIGARHALQRVTHNRCQQLSIKIEHGQVCGHASPIQNAGQGRFV